MRLLQYLFLKPEQHDALQQTQQEVAQQNLLDVVFVWQQYALVPNACRHQPQCHPLSPLAKR